MGAKSTNSGKKCEVVEVMSEIGIRTYYHKILCDVVPSGTCASIHSALYIKCMSVGYDLTLNCCSNLYYVIIVYLKPDNFFFLLVRCRKAG